MKAFFDPRTDAHEPQRFLLRGAFVKNEERRERAERLMRALTSLQIEAQTPGPVPHALLERVHSPQYLEFLKGAYAAWRALPSAAEEVLANVQPRLADAAYPAHVVGRAGWHMGDLACPLGEGTWTAATAAAATAHAAAKALTQSPVTYALARPPGHHAAREVAGGHCYLNNAAVAAETLLAAGARPAILDIDVHHGNGTQAIFYERADVKTVSVHADPDRFYPFFTGRADEVGRGDGKGANRNLPLPLGTRDAAFLAAVEEGLDIALADGADALVLSLGLDVHEGDPLAGFSVTTDGIARAGARIAERRVPTVIVQEGGYLGEALTANLAAFLSAFQRTAHA